MLRQYFSLQGLIGNISITNNRSLTTVWTWTQLIAISFVKSFSQSYRYAELGVFFRPKTIYCYRSRTYYLTLYRNAAVMFSLERKMNYFSNQTQSGNKKKKKKNRTWDQGLAVQYAST